MPPHESDSHDGNADPQQDAGERVDETVTGVDVLPAVVDDVVVESPEAEAHIRPEPLPLSVGEHPVLLQLPRLVEDEERLAAEIGACRRRLGSAMTIGAATRANVPSAIAP